MAFGKILDDKTATQIQTSVAAAIQRRDTNRRGQLFQLALLASLLVSLLIIVVLLVDVIQGGWSVLVNRPWDFLTGQIGSGIDADALGIQQGLYGSFWIAVFVTVFAFPIGIGAAIFLEEYTSNNSLLNLFSHLVELLVRNLAGVPSVVYGLLGLYFFVEGIPFPLLESIPSLAGPNSNGRSVVSAGLTLSILVLPIVIITAQESLRAVPSGIKEGSYGVGATRWETIRHQSLPYAAPGILTGTLLSTSRAIGEAAPLILVGATTGFLGSNPAIWEVDAIRDNFTAMPIIITEWTQKTNTIKQDIFIPSAAAAIVVLLVFVLLLNLLAILLRHRFEKKRA